MEEAQFELGVKELKVGTDFMSSSTYPGPQHNGCCVLKEATKKFQKVWLQKKNTIVCTYINNIKEVIISKGVNKILSW